MSNLGHTEKQFSGKERKSQKHMSWSNGSNSYLWEDTEELLASLKTEGKLESCFMPSLAKEGLSVLWLCHRMGQCDLTGSCSDWVPQEIMSSSMSTFQHRREGLENTIVFNLFLNPTKLKQVSPTFQTLRDSPSILSYRNLCSSPLPGVSSFCYIVRNSNAGLSLNLLALCKVLP